MTRRETKLIRVEPERLWDYEKELNEAAELIAAGKLVAIPTETVYGLAADATNEAAVSSIFGPKGVRRTIR